MPLEHSAQANPEPAAGGTVPGGIRITQLTVTRNGRRTLTGVCMDAPAGYTCVLGASGSGKSTLLSAIAGTLRPAGGRVEIGGEVLSDAGTGVFLPPEHRRLGMVFQDYVLWPHLTALDNVALPLRHRHGAAARARASEWLALTGLSGLERRYPAELSGGQQQRVALARALAVQPRLVLLDEPLSALDAGTRGELREVLRRLAADLGFSAVHVTHDAGEAFALARHLVVLSGGRAVQAGPPDEVFMRPETRDVARLTGAVSLVPVRVLARDAGAATVLLGDVALRVPAAAGLAAGSDALLVLRPYALNCVPEPRANPLRARRVDAGYRGDRWQIEAEVAPGARVSFWHDARPDPEFDLYLRPDRAWAIPDGRGS
jgi:ABC-type Fe3+/spermidine/putrescine transport system ATPase subunit